jgi:hypothetical protein
VAALAAWISCLGSACDRGSHCGEGTYLEDDECRAGIEPYCGDGTVLHDGACVPQAGAGGQCGEGTHLEEGACVADVSGPGNAARLYDVHLTEPAEFVALADPSLHSAFLSGTNLVFLGVYAPTTDALRVFGGGGTRRMAGTFALDRATAFDAPASETGGRLETEGFVFQLSGFGATTPVRLVDAAVTDAVTSAGAGVIRVASGRLSGVLTPAAADAVFIEQANASLLELLHSIDVPPSEDEDGDGSKESWRMTLEFTTVPVWLF